MENSNHASVSFLIDLSKYEKKVYSQNGEDGILEEIFHIIGVTNKYHVEIGCGDGTECNTRYLREYYSFQGVLFDRNYEPNPAINLQKEYITRDNINALFQKNNVPSEFDLLSIDIDGIDFYVWKVLSDYRPRVVIIEYNRTHLPNEDKVVIYDPNFTWDGTSYYGASILAYYKLGRSKGYSLVYAENKGVNIFFIRDDLLSNLNLKFLNVNDVNGIYKNNPIPHPEDGWKRSYISSESILHS